MEEQNRMCSNSSSGGGGVGVSRSSKKQKQKKIPQRGLGVAQLEKIRIEEQQKKDVANVANVASAIFTSPPIVSPSNSSSLTVPLLNYPASQSSSLVSFPSMSATSMSSSQNPMLRSSPPVPGINSFYLNSVPPLNHSNGRGFDVGWPSIPAFHGNAHLPKMWDPYELNHEADNFRWDHGLPPHPELSLPFESSPIMPLSQASASSLINIPFINSASISNFQMEPPSNQSLYSSFSSLWPDEEKMAYGKRPYPVPLDTSVQSKLPRIATRSDECSTFGNRPLFNSDPAASITRDTLLLPSSSTPDLVPKKSNKENGNQNGDFLTLAPPSTHPCAIGEVPVVSSGLRSAGLSHQQPLFSFFPAPKVHQETSTMNNHGSSNGSSGGTVDLNLKL